MVTLLHLFAAKVTSLGNYDRARLDLAPFRVRIEPGSALDGSNFPCKGPALLCRNAPTKLEIVLNDTIASIDRLGGL